MNPYLWLLWALLALLVVLVLLAVVVALVAYGSAVAIALFEDVRSRWRVQLLRRRVRRALPAIHREVAVHGATFWAVPEAGAPGPLRPDWSPVFADRVAPSADEMAVVDATTDHGRAL